ncbi:MAG: hypothetical protein FJ278_22190, partial [Planctomycetes bacterium]|nr:hypothetical protein [Planctomycetota bacterium]
MSVRLLVALSLVVLAASASSLHAQPRVTFSASLANGPDAEMSRGTGTGICRHDAPVGVGTTVAPTLESLPGQPRFWPVREDADAICWLAAGNFDKRRGTVAFR